MFATALLALLAPAVSLAAPTGLTITVTNSEGLPIPNAMIRFVQEKALHRVHTETGRWTGSVLYLPDGNEVILEPGVELNVQVFAAGYQPWDATVAIPKRRKQAVDVSLQPMNLKPEGTSVQEIETLTAVRAWLDADIAYAKDPSKSSARSRHASMLKAGEAALTWLQVAGETEVAHQVCSMAARWPDQCETATR
jgi:hypothetical protein